MADLSPKTDILVIEDGAKYIKVTERTIYRLAAAKKRPALEVGYRRVDQASVCNGMNC
jgi:hypothetical protein